jgi:hypothetical protein
MRFLQAGNLIYIPDILGHISIQTTEIHARADTKQKRIALEKGLSLYKPKEKPIWQSDQNLGTWLKAF